MISGALVVIGADLGPAELSNQQKELITAATSLGALLAGIGSGALADVVGRKWVIAVADVVFIAGAVIQAVAQGVWVMIAGYVFLFQSRPSSPLMLLFQALCYWYWGRLSKPDRSPLHR